jgi:hypothetical protein
VRVVMRFGKTDVEAALAAVIFEIYPDRSLHRIDTRFNSNRISF